MSFITHPLFDEVYHYEKINSTSSQALKLIQNQEAHGHFLVIADTQTSGKGRKGGSWFSPLGGIWMTAAFHQLPIYHGLTLVIGNCIHEALLKNYPELNWSLRIKWPNDLFLNDHKVAGILTEHFPAHDYTLVGIGIDTNIVELPSELEPIASTLQNFLGEVITNQNIIIDIFNNVENSLPQFLEAGLGSFTPYHNQYSNLIGKRLKLLTEFGDYEGECLGINKEGAIILELRNGLRQPFLSGSVEKWESIDL